MLKLTKLIFIVLLFLPTLAKAADSDIVISEVMANPAGSDTGKEWFEIGNNGEDEINLNNWKTKVYNKAEDGTLTKTIIFKEIVIKGKEYAIVSNSSDYQPCETCQIIRPGSFTLTNDRGKLVLTNPDGTYSQEIFWDKDNEQFLAPPAEGRSLELVGPPEDPELTLWQESRDISGSTPGAQNSVSIVKPLEIPAGIFPVNEIIYSSEHLINFTWQDNNLDVEYELAVSLDADLTDPIIDETDLDSKEFLAEDMLPGIYYWQVRAYNSKQSVLSPIYTFEVKEKVYSDKIIVNEISPSPSKSNIDEWIELYNDSDEAVDLDGWVIEDVNGSIHRYTVRGQIIAPRSYLVLYKKQTGITLNNDEDGVKLSNPNGKLVFESPVFNHSEKDTSWARKSNGNWAWTTRQTLGKKNIIVIPVDEEAEKKTLPSLNTIPQEIKSGQVDEFENKFVKITGELVSTRGNSVWVDDGTGAAKFYIGQGVEKPEMKKGDQIEASGVVEFFRQAWRVLIYRQQDIKVTPKIILPAAPKPSVKTTVQKKVATNSIAPKEKPKLTPIKPLIPTVKAATDIKAPPPPAPKKNPALEISKAITGLAIVFLVLLIIKVQSMPKRKTIGGNFGNDFT